MTILPKKKHESRKNDQDHDSDNRNRGRNRNAVRNSRLPHQHQAPDEFDFDAPLDASVPSLTPPLTSELGDRDPHEGLPHKRYRQGSPYYLPPTSSSVSHHSRVASREESPIVDEEGTEDGYNSSDEHGPVIEEADRAVSKGLLSTEDYTQREVEFERDLREKKGFIIKQMATDGACMFRAVADQVYGDQEMNTVVRRHCMDYMVQNRDFFSQFITEDFLSYIRRKRVEHSHGNHIEMQALSEMYNRPIEIYQYSTEPLNTFLGRSINGDDSAPIRLSYHGNVHYNSIIDPYNPTVGVGLGLAGYKPGSENERLLNSATQESEALLLEQAMLEDKMKATDWEATDDQLAELAARESYLQWMKDQKKNSLSHGGASCSTSTSTQSSKRSSPPHDGCGNSRRSPPHQPSTSRKSPPHQPSTSRRTPPHQPSTSRPSPPREANRAPPIDNHPRAMGSASPLNKVTLILPLN